ncbi:unnamed protein product, partial [Symbiodinium sp. CCMP2456]
ASKDRYNAMVGLKRRITRSLYLQTPRGMQLQAALVADSGARGSQGLDHRPSEVEQWETERRQLAAEEAQYQQEFQERECEENEQSARDEELYEAHRAAAYRDWELGDAGQSANVASLILPNDLNTLHLTMHVETAVEPVPAAVGLREGDEPSNKAPTLEPNGDLYNKAYDAWRRGHLTDDGVTLVFGQDWLFLFQITRDGVGEDTLVAAAA